MIIKCSFCNIDFDRPKYKMKDSKNYFCSKECKYKYSRDDIIHKKFGSIKVLDYGYKDKGGNIKYKCICDCGKTVYILSTNIKKSRNKCRYCVKRKYIGEISGSYFNSLKRRADKRKNQPLEITQLDIWEKFIEQDRKCAYTGLELFWKDGSAKGISTASVDRKDSNFGYIKSNIQIVHVEINRMKLDYNEEYFLYLCEKIVNFDNKFYPITNYKSKSRKGKWNGYEDLSGKYWYDIKARAERLNIEFNIDIKDCWNLYLQQGGICALSGIPIKFVEPGRKKQTEKTASLDRIDSTKGYIIGNVQWLHKHVNLMKLNHNQDYFINLCTQVTEHRKEV